MQPPPSRDGDAAQAQIIAASRRHALVRVRVNGTAPGAATLRFVTAGGEPGAGRALPAGAAANGDRTTLAFAVPLAAVQSRPRELALVEGARSWPLSWSPPDPLLTSGSRAPVPERVHTGMAFRGATRSTWHVAIGGAAWFVYLSEMLFQSTVGLPEAWGQLVGAVAVTALLVGVLAVAWVGWNLWLHRRHGERRRRALRLDPSLQRDALGRRIVSSVRDRAEARRIVVTVAGEGPGAVKRFAEPPDHA